MNDITILTLQAHITERRLEQTRPCGTFEEAGVLLSKALETLVTSTYMCIEVCLC